MAYNLSGETRMDDTMGGDNGKVAAKQQILFVDDEPNVLQGLRRMLHPLRHEWEMAFAGSGPEALEHLEHTPCDVVVSDMRMPGMDGPQLLAHINLQYPHIVRLVLSGHSDREMVLRSVRPAHQYLAKPCDAMTLKAMITRACALHVLLGNAALRRLVSGMTTLPSLPALYLQVQAAIQDPQVSVGKVGEVIGQDMGMTAKILQLVNSAFFGLQRPITTPTEAVRLLGLDTIKALVLSVHIFIHCDMAMLRALSLHTLWQHSLAIGACAKRIIETEGGDPSMADEAFTAGLLHDVGKLVLGTNLPELYVAACTLAQEQDLTDWEGERVTYGATHTEVGAYLLGLWGLPDPLVEALAYHHCPSACPTRALSPLMAVHVANALGDENETPKHTGSVDLRYLEEIGLDDRLAHWHKQCQPLLEQEIGI